MTQAPVAQSPPSAASQVPLHGALGLHLEPMQVAQHWLLEVQLVVQEPPEQPWLELQPTAPPPWLQLPLLQVFCEVPEQLLAQEPP